MSKAKSPRGNAHPPAASLVYLVDDDHRLGELGAEIFTSEGFEALFFPDPRLALKALTEAKRKPELLVTDYVMGPMNGLQLIESSRRIHPTIKTILLSGTVGEAFVRKQPIKPDTFMAKPYRADALIQTARELLAERNGEKHVRP
ncbi:MAG: response regulator [Verrucomicrobiota bacterium]